MERGSDSPGTRLQDFWQVWAKNHAHPRVVSLLQHGYRLDFKILPKLSKIPLILSKYHNKTKRAPTTKRFRPCLQKRTITHVRKPTTLGYYSRLFLVPKPMKQWRPVMDLSMLNNHLHVFPCPNSFTISKISEISNKKGVFQFWAPLFVSQQLP